MISCKKISNRGKLIVVCLKKLKITIETLQKNLFTPFPKRIGSILTSCVNALGLFFQDFMMTPTSNNLPK